MWKPCSQLIIHAYKGFVSAPILGNYVQVFLRNTHKITALLVKDRMDAVEILLPSRKNVVSQQPCFR